MAKKAACKCKATECEECPEWIFTFADLVMLMMGFFVILWVLKPSADPKIDPVRAAHQEEDWNESIIGIREQFGGGLLPTDSDSMRDTYNRMQRNGPAGKGTNERKVKGAEGTDPQVQSIRAGQQSTVGGKLMFDQADAKLSPDSNRTLDEIAKSIRGHRNIVLIKGHASRDDFPDNASAEQKMDLSIRRAQAVADYLTRAGVEPEILRVQGCSTFEPVRQRAYNSTTQGSNRRVEVEATASLVEDMQDKSAVSKPVRE